MEFNYTTPSQAFDINNNSLFNSGCAGEYQKIADMCSKFKLDVASTMNHRFTIALIILFILVLYQLYIRNKSPEYSKSINYKKYIDLVIDFIIINLIVYYIFYIFFI